MFPRSLKVFTITMIITGILLLPTVVPHAVQDLQDLKTVIDSTTETINAAPNNSSWGFFDPAAPVGAMGTADLVTNITTTILRAQYLLNVDQTAWTTPPNGPNGPNGTNEIANPAVPPAVPPVNIPTPAALTDVPEVSPALPVPSNNSLDDPYIDYVSSVPNLASALTKLGGAWHKELNKPVWDAIDALQQTITSFSTSMLSAQLIHSPSVLRTIRGSSSLEDAQVAWSRLLNLPGRGSPKKRYVVGGERLAPMGRFYTHAELWGREEKKAMGAETRPGAAMVNSEVVPARVARRFGA
ncbi:hypothetical protein CC80DRAFT_457815 [Byssothecium circinans]|uniref:Uncharacterized protein n=1 Tax=Byssothecium circinans TaxID=147558 RepID=A0A6A5TAM8_9PLEO|nr:hypothetical protein CC80DRAFT_457815 [Byssothecium circinans]